MAYLNTHARTTGPTKNDLFQPAGRTPTLFGVFMGYVKDTKDVQKNGRLRVWIPEFASSPENEDGWIIVNYCSPFAGATNVETANQANVETFNGTQTSYGFWMIPPDINCQVLCMFINGDPSRGIWIGSLYNQYMNNMMPGMAGSADNYQYPGKYIPVAEYNKWDPKATDPDQITRPYEATKFKGLGNQGLITDFARGVSNSSARREAPSAVFGILTPGPAIDPDVPVADIRRKGGSAFIMDDAPGSESVVLTTKTGAQIKLDESNGYVYLINRDGTAWIEMDQLGNVNIFGATNVSMRAQKDFNIRADRNINIEAGQNIFMKAAQDTVTTTTSFTYDVNNIPKPTTIPYYKYVGEGKGEGGNIVTQALNNWHSTTKNTAFLTVVNNNLNINVGNALSLTTIKGGQDYNSKQGIKMTTSAAFDLAANGNIRAGSNGSVSVVGQSNVVVCSSAAISLNAQNDIKVVSASNIGITSLGVRIDGGLRAGGPVSLGGSVPATNPIASEGALSANTSPKAEIKPLNEKINILTTWADPESKFKRDAQGLSTTVSILPTYEPCPEHEKFSLTSISGYAPKQTEGAKTYEGSGGAGNNAPSSPPTNTDPGANNTDLPPPDANENAVVKDFNMPAYECQLKIHEGIKYTSYLCSAGYPTGGIGHLLRTPNETSQFPVPTPITETQVSSWFQTDASISISGAQRLLKDVWQDLSDVRKRACADLCFNLGENRFSKFKNFLSAMKAKDYNTAGAELRNSTWFTQVGRRGPNIVTMIVNNIDPNGCDRKTSV